METLISAIQKLVIKDVAWYADRKIEPMREVFDGEDQDSVDSLLYTL